MKNITQDVAENLIQKYSVKLNQAEERLYCVKNQIFNSIMNDECTKNLNAEQEKLMEYMTIINLNVKTLMSI